MHARRGSSVRIVVPSGDDDDASDGAGADARPGLVSARTSMENMCVARARRASDGKTRTRRTRAVDGMSRAWRRVDATRTTRAVCGVWFVIE